MNGDRRIPSHPAEEYLRLIHVMIPFLESFSITQKVRYMLKNADQGLDTWIALSCHEPHPKERTSAGVGMLRCGHLVQGEFVWAEKMLNRILDLSSFLFTPSDARFSLDSFFRPR